MQFITDYIRNSYTVLMLLAGMAALMGITGMGLVKKSRKEDEEE